MPQASQASLAELRFLFGGAKGHLRDQTELGDEVGVTQAHISQIETGKKRPSQKLIERLARAFRMEPRDVRAAVAETQRRRKAGKKQVREVF